MTKIRPLLALAICSAVTQAAEPPDPYAVMREVRESRERLVTGVFVASGDYVFMTKEGAEFDRDGPVEVRVVFDRPADLLRFELDRPPLMGPPDPDLFPDLQLPDEPIARMKVIASPEETYQWSEDYGDFKKGPLPAIPVHVRPPDLVHSVMPAWDVQLIGLYNGVDMFTHAFFGLEQFLDIAHAPNDVSEISEVRPGVLQLEFTGMKEENGLYSRLLIDTKRGHTPLRKELWATRPDGPDRLESWMETSWREVNEVWVPTSMQSEKGRRQGNGTFHSLRLTFDWAGVNKPVDPGMFEPSQLPLDPKTHIVDRRLDVPMTVGSIADPTTLPSDAKLFPSGLPRTWREELEQLWEKWDSKDEDRAAGGASP